MEKVLMDLAFENICIYELSREIINNVPDGKDIKYEEFYEKNKPLLASYENKMNLTEDKEKLKIIQKYINIENKKSLNENQIFCFIKDVFLLNIGNIFKNNYILNKYINPLLFNHLRNSFKNYHLMSQIWEEENIILNNKNDELEKKLEKYMKENALKNDEIKNLNDKINELGNKTNKYEENIENLKSMICKKIEDMKLINKNMKEDFDGKNEELKLKNRNMEEEIDVLKLKNNNMEEEIDVLKLENNNMKEKINVLELENNNMKEDYNKKNKELKLKNNNMEEEIEVLKLQNKNMKEEFDAKIFFNENEIKKLQNYYKYYEEESIEVRGYLREEMIKNDKITKINKNISEKNIELCNTAQKKDYKIKELESIIGSLKDEKSILEKLLYINIGAEEEEEGDPKEKVNDEEKLRHENTEIKKRLKKLKKKMHF